MEIWDLYDANRRFTGKELIRGEIIPKGYYHLVVHVWIKNSAGEFLISRRSADRPTYPLKWECVGGSVVKGEDSMTGALRETKEEVGIDLLPEKGRIIFSKVRSEISGQYFGDIMDVWLFSYDGPVSLEEATTKEVAQVQWMTREEVLQKYESGELVPTLDYFFETEGLYDQEVL